MPVRGRPRALRVPTTSTRAGRLMPSAVASARDRSPRSWRESCGSSASGTFRAGRAAPTPRQRREPDRP
jgi:hypothetical protein